MTLADALIREWSTRRYRQHIDLHGWIPRHVALARKFVLDDDMSAFMADLAYASMPSGADQNIPRLTRRVNDWVDGLRLMSRLPHDLIWIEYNSKRRAARSRDAYQAATANYTGPERCGWLIHRVPAGHLGQFQEGDMSTFTADVYEAIPCSSQSVASIRDFDAPLVDVPNAGPWSYIWTPGSDPFPNTQFLEKADWVVSRALTGLNFYRSPHVSLGKPEFMRSNPGLERSANEVGLRTYLEEQAGDLRYLWALLATINDLPVERVWVKPDKGHMVRGNYKKFSEHTVIRLRVPARVSLSAVAKRALRASRRRAHDVRGHWRVDWRAAPAALCEHAWRSEEDGVRCTHCRGRKTWIRDHQRGDASLGFVLHDYALERGEKTT